jgi:2'-5' RNA ligase
MALLVLAYPQLQPEDAAWIQAIRADYDPQYTLIQPHITLVFPTTHLDPTAGIAHLTTQAAQFTRIALTIRCAMVVSDPLSPLTHLFLVPDEGFSQIVKLHDALYTKQLADALRLDIPFIPHITIGAHTDPYLVKRVADTINQREMHIHGSIDTLEVITDTLPVVGSLARIPLG